MYPFSPLDFGFSDQQQQIADVVHEFANAEIAPNANDIDHLNAMPGNLWQKMGAMGLLGITVSSEYGGSHCDYLCHILAMEQISRASAAVGLSYAAHSNLCVNQLFKHANEQQKRQFLPALISGEGIGALAMSESNAGSDVMSMQLRATPVDGGYLLNGSKMWITNGPTATVLIVYARTAPDAISAFIIEQSMPGFHCAQKLDKLGMRGSDTSELVFQDCYVPSENLLGKINQGAQILMSGLDIERLILSGGPLGIMQACMDICLPYVRERQQFGQRIGNFQLVQAKLADMYSNMNAIRSYVYTVARNYDAQHAPKQDTAGCILLAAEHASKMASDTIQLLGGNGYTNDYPAARLLRDAKLYEIGGGTSEIRRLIIGKTLVNMFCD
ncbi:acyl-CoA dehydrogenase family protein [Thaumasiovibrio sp. DFM-14]|uniref:acyl-CoA dehydrogenase family protein n=1 Tax=Thaumasiovibrio sp. DFM-14 TaxID=3384792 RepID=UPI00399F1D05